MNYSHEFCDREYNARLAIPDHPQIFARWAEQAAATRRLRACLIDLAFGDTSVERVDLFPAHSDGAPLLIFIHGGYWRSLDKSDFSWIATPFVNHGISVALTNYGLAPKTRIEDMVRQTLKAVSWLYRNADRLGFDPQRLFVAGHSAGAHLAAMALAAWFDAYADDLPRSLLKGGLVLSGLYDLEPLMFAEFVNVDLKLDAKRARALSPIHLPPASAAPFVTAVGALESSEFRRQTDLIGTHWKQNLRRKVPIPGANHLTICDELANPANPLFDAALDLLRR